MVDRVADYLDELEKYPVASGVGPGEVKSRLPGAAPLKGESMDAVMKDFEEIIMPGITHWQHPGWFAYFPANNSPSSILAEILTAGLGAQCMVWQTSPAATELEEVVTCWLRDMIGLPKDMAGVIQSTASEATLCSLITAREKATGFESNKKGLNSGLVVYASTEAHSSVDKGAKIAGFGEENIRRIPVDENFAMIPEKLEEQIKADRAGGLVPSCVVATVGTTSSGAVDPLEQIGEVCRRNDVFLHVDGAYAGTAAVVPEKRWILDGVEHADSFVFNPHKWMLVNFDCSAYFVKDAGLLVRSLEIHPEYLKTGVDSEVVNFRDWGIPLGRRFRALKLWFVLRSYGLEGIRDIVSRHMELAQEIKKRVEEHEHLELMAPVHFGLVCFRLNDGRGERELEVLNHGFLQNLNETGKMFLTHTMLDKKYVLRMSIGSRTTQARHVDAAWDTIMNTAGEVL